MSAAPVAVLLPLFQCVSSSFFPPVSSSDPLFLAASPVHGSYFACLRSGLPSPLPPERKIPTCSLQIGIIQSWKILRRHGISLFCRRTSLLRRISLRGTISLRILSSLQSSFAASLLRSLFCGFPFVAALFCGSPLLRPPFAAPLWLSPFVALPFCGPSFVAPFAAPLEKAIFGPGRG